MKRVLIAASFVLTMSACVAAQESGAVLMQQSGTIASQAGPDNGPRTVAAFQVHLKPLAPVVGAPYSAAITNESVQTLADGNRIVQTFAGSAARDSQGRTRQDALLPKLGTLPDRNAPHFVFIQDPVSQISYTLDLTNKTAQKISAPPPPGDGVPGADISAAASPAEMPAPVPAGGKFFAQMQDVGPSPDVLSAPPPGVAIGARVAGDGEFQAATEDLGSQTMEGVLVNGTRTTRTIPAGQIGNEHPIKIVTEVWYSPDLKTVVYSKRTDPRAGEQTFKLTNIVRAEPDPSLFTVPADFTVVDGPKPIIYRPVQ